MIGIMCVFGILMIGGGYIGYKKAGSEQSLIMGCVSGIITGISAGISLLSQKIGYIIFFLLTIILIIVFGIRLLKTLKIMPSGVLLLITIGTAIFTFIQLKALY